MAAEMPGVPVVRRGEDADCDLALVCWPAQAIRSFPCTHPRGARARRVAFCNGAWARAEGADEHGCCYVRAVAVGDRAVPGYRGWRVADAATAGALRAAGLGVVRSTKHHEAHLWGKALYVLPLALACADTDLDGRAVQGTAEWAEWMDAVRGAAEGAVGAGVLVPQLRRVAHLLGRTPRGWRPSSSPEELAYFRGCLCAG